MMRYTSLRALRHNICFISCSVSHSPGACRTYPMCIARRFLQSGHSLTPLEKKTALRVLDKDSKSRQIISALDWATTTRVAMPREQLRTSQPTTSSIGSGKDTIREQVDALVEQSRASTGLESVTSVRRFLGSKLTALYRRVLRGMARRVAAPGCSPLLRTQTALLAHRKEIYCGALLRELAAALARDVALVRLKDAAKTLACLASLNYPLRAGPGEADRALEAFGGDTKGDQRPGTVGEMRTSDQVRALSDETTRSDGIDFGLQSKDSQSAGHGRLGDWNPTRRTSGVQKDDLYSSVTPSARSGSDERRCNADGTDGLVRRVVEEFSSGNTRRQAEVFQFPAAFLTLVTSLIYGGVFHRRLVGTALSRELYESLVRIYGTTDPGLVANKRSELRTVFHSVCIERPEWLAANGSVSLSSSGKGDCALPSTKGKMSGLRADQEYVDFCNRFSNQLELEHEAAFLPWSASDGWTFPPGTPPSERVPLERVRTAAGRSQREVLVAGLAAQLGGLRGWWMSLMGHFTASPDLVVEITPIAGSPSQPDGKADMVGTGFQRTLSNRSLEQTAQQARKVGGTLIESESIDRRGGENLPNNKAVRRRGGLLDDGDYPGSGGDRSSSRSSAITDSTGFTPDPSNAVVIVPLSKGCFCRDSHILRGIVATKIRQLRALGYRVETVDSGFLRMNKTLKQRMLALKLYGPGFPARLPPNVLRYAASATAQMGRGKTLLF